MRLQPYPLTENRIMKSQFFTRQLFAAGLGVCLLAPAAQAATVDFDPAGEFAAQFNGGTYAEAAAGGLNGSIGITLANTGVASFDGTQSESLTIAADGDAITIGAFINISSFGTTDGGQFLRLGVTKGGADTFANLPFATLTVADASAGTFRFEERGASSTDGATFSLSTVSWYYFETTLSYDQSASENVDYTIAIANATAAGTVGSEIHTWSLDATDATVNNSEFTTGATVYGAFKGADANETGAAVIDNFYVSNTGASLVPEPGSLALLGLGGLLIASRRRRA